MPSIGFLLGCAADEMRPKPPAVACALLRAGIETYSDPTPRTTVPADYYVVGECRGSADLDEVPYTVELDGHEVSTGALNCRSGLWTKNSAFTGRAGRHQVTIRFAEGIGKNADAWAMISTG